MHVMVVPSWYSHKENKVHGSFFKEQFIALQEKGCKITVAYNEIWPITKLFRIKDKRGINFEIEDGLRTYRYKDYNYLPKNSNMFKLFNKRMEKLYLEILKKEGKVDVIHAHSAFWGGISAAYVAKKYNIPFVLTEHSSMRDSMYVKKSYEKWIKRAYDSSDKLICVGNSLKQELQNYTDNDILVIHNMLDYDIFKPKNKQKTDTIELFSLAYLVEGKGMDRLIRSFSNCFRGKKINLKIGGDGVLREELAGLIKSLNMENQIKLLGALSREEVVQHMNDCDAFVLASEHETFGMVYIEANALGKPVLGTKNGGAEDIINEINGIIVENRSDKAFEEGLKSLVNKIDRFDSDKIREDSKSRFSKEVIVNKIIKLYENLKE